ncbi:histone-arginine methyltransferase METTL23 isoform X1 [Carassius auratus]|uniref:Histone-arginine methyltransferase METTL23 isoform X1 n=1 Tax=Carassius auratus TaxID=7957 RepID=A0A6P6JTM2_CARAU|nr:methyltransferase-like protein 23 isoform X1 [Carassius auratus]
MDESSLTVVEKLFTFEDCGGSQSLTVSIPEVLDPHYGMYVWPCAVVLSQYVWKTRSELQHKTVLEIAPQHIRRVMKSVCELQLGAGVSLPGVVAAKCGARVILSDSAELPLCLRNCRRSCDANHLPDVPVIGLTWGQVSPELLSLPPVDVILGSDVFYEPEDFEDVLVTVSFIVRRNPHAQLWTTYQERSADWSIDALLLKWDLKCVNVPLETFDANKTRLAGSTLPGNHTVQMMIISRREL